jgi:hypothetical protein
VLLLLLVLLVLLLLLLMLLLLLLLLSLLLLLLLSSSSLLLWSVGPDLICVSPGMNLMIANQICTEHGDTINVPKHCDLPLPIASPRPAFTLAFADATKEFVSKPTYKGLSRWLTGQLKANKNEDHVHASLQKGTYLKPLLSFVQGGASLEESFVFQTRLPGGSSRHGVWPKPHVGRAWAQHHWFLAVCS